ncbi:MAG: hypothetical protein KDK28_22090 [Maritimibacter sp.]|nr:hypothetical protein [Maritimibacter sp.]
MSSQEGTNVGMNVLYATSFNVVSNGVDIKVTLHDSLPTGNLVEEGAEVARVVLGVLAMSPQAAKDLGHLLLDTISKMEQNFGEIKTPYLEELKRTQAAGGS